ncbi:hypothetical protein ICN28_07740 [Polynucleobacter sp. 30F-ANTBAC]|jgi:tetratricopeptide (TPR) repeat protein|uniref:tetratricopeptide repeat protein n=1 Tax=Polynucleobacter sp. 30F-ANTBAC TaxID=2689095 RepID=UPI001C0D1345|nr:tetratricopeptide repeat protein [Polynucleobacter sp. 30F-ANTBAC]MBU3600409.1 hypothetical protein [Polynucleobacter sp. 30F-ANTBAC]
MKNIFNFEFNKMPQIFFGAFFLSLALNTSVVFAQEKNLAEHLKDVQSYADQKKYPEALQSIEAAFKLGGMKPESLGKAHDMAAYFAYQSKDYEKAISHQKKSIEHFSGKPQAESQLLLLADSQVKLKDFDGYTTTLQQLVQFFPRKEYWSDLILRVSKKHQFSEAMQLEAFRLQREVGALLEEADYIEMALMSDKAGFPAEAFAIVKSGFDSQKLGVGPKSASHKQLKNSLEKKSVEDKKSLNTALEERAKKMTDGFALHNVGFNYALHGEMTKGLELMELAKSKPNKKSSEALLEYGLAAYWAGDIPKARSIFSSISGPTGASELAKLWNIYLSQSK